MTTYAQIFCTLADLEADLELNGSERQEKIWPKIQSASAFLEKELGWFLPVTLTHTRQGSGETQMFIPPMLSLTSIANDGTTLTADSDYKLGPDQPLWANGPRSWLDVLEDATNLSVWCTDIDGVVFSGLTGLYNLTKSLGIAVGTGDQAIDATSLFVTDGSALSPGTVVVIGSEQELVTATASPTDSGANLGAAISDAQDYVITLDDASKLNVGEIIRIDLEQMKVLDINTSTNQVYVGLARGWNKTMKDTHADDSDVYVYRTFTVERAVNGTSAAAHSAAAAISQQLVPADVNQLARKIAARMLKDSQGGYAGLIGDEMTGTARYLYILPHELEDIKRNYRVPTSG